MIHHILSYMSSFILSENSIISDSLSWLNKNFKQKSYIF